jgi:hypothetical protein
MAPSRKTQAGEVAVFLLLIVPSIALSLFSIRQGQLSFVLTGSAFGFVDSLLGFALFQKLGSARGLTG